MSREQRQAMNDDLDRKKHHREQVELLKASTTDYGPFAWAGLWIGLGIYFAAGEVAQALS